MNAPLVQPIPAALSGRSTAALSTTALPKLLFTVEEAAECLGIKRTKMYALIKTGEIDTIQVGRLRRVRLAALESYVSRLADAARAA